MLYINSNEYHIKNVNIFGMGEVFKQLKPLLEQESITCNDIYDDTIVSRSLDKKRINNKKNSDTIFCVGYKNMSIRYSRFKELKSQGFRFVSFVANNAVISTYTNIGNGSIINQGVIIDNFVKIGESVFINIGCTISHHSVIENNVFIAPGVNVAGYVTVNEGVFLGTNATIIDHVNIGEYSLVAAGAVVINDVPPYTLVAGNPAKVKKCFKEGL